VPIWVDDLLLLRPNIGEVPRALAFQARVVRLWAARPVAARLVPDWSATSLRCALLVGRSSGEAGSDSGHQLLSLRRHDDSG